MGSTLGTSYTRASRTDFPGRNSPGAGGSVHAAVSRACNGPVDSPDWVVRGEAEGKARLQAPCQWNGNGLSQNPWRFGTRAMRSKPLRQKLGLILRQSRAVNR
jgi:hypothetical protein